MTPINEESIYRIVIEEVEKLRDTLPPEQYFSVNKETVLFGKGSSIDSLSLVSVIVDLEERLSSEYHVPVSLTDDDAMTREISPFDNITNLSEYILEVIRGKRENSQLSSDYV